MLEERGAIAINATVWGVIRNLCRHILLPHAMIDPLTQLFSP
ncbi:MAG: hypothetical protein ACFBSF_05035 [Leptolyngbyaceae cyanobacterium]